MKIWRGRTKIPVKMMQLFCACSINPEIFHSCITLMLCSTSWAKLWQDLKIGCFQGQQTIVHGRHSDGNKWHIDLIHWWSIIQDHLSDAIEVCPLSMIHNFRHCKSKLSLLNWPSRT
jgi:hypothetical protein